MQRQAFAALIAYCSCWGLGHAVAGTYQWPVEFQVGQFRVYSQVPIPDRTALHTLADLPQEITDELGIAVSGSPVHLFLFQDQTALDRYLAWLVPGTPTRPALFVQQGERLMVFAFLRGNLREDLRHECTHALLHAQGLDLPLWLDEGLAEYFEHRSAATPTQAVVVPDPAVCRELQQLRELAQMTDRHYRQSQAWVHYLLYHSPASRRQLQMHLAALTR